MYSTGLHPASATPLDLKIPYRPFDLLTSSARFSLCAVLKLDSVSFWTRSNPGAILKLITLKLLHTSKGIGKEYNALPGHK